MSTKTAKAREVRKTLARRLLEGTQRNDVNEVKAAIDEGAEVDVLDENGSAAIHTAALCNLRNILKLLISSNANLDIKQAKKDRCTAAHVAAAVGNVKCLYMLLQAGADMSVQNKRGKTVMEWAMQHDQTACIQVLCTFKDAQKKGITTNVMPELETELSSFKISPSPVAVNVTDVNFGANILPAGYHPINQVQNLERRASQAESKMSELASKLKEAEDAVRRYREQLGSDSSDVSISPTSSTSSSISIAPATVKISLPPPPPPSSQQTKRPEASPAASPVLGEKVVISPVMRLATPGRSNFKAATLTSPIRMGVIHLLGSAEMTESDMSSSDELVTTPTNNESGSVKPNDSVPCSPVAKRTPAEYGNATPSRGLVVTREALLVAARSLHPATPSKNIKAATLPSALCIAGASPASGSLVSVLSEIRAGVTLRPTDNKPAQDANAPSLMDELKRTLKMKRRHMRQESRVSEDWSIAAITALALAFAFASARKTTPVKPQPQLLAGASPRKALSFAPVKESTSSYNVAPVASLVDSADKENAF